MKAQITQCHVCHNVVANTAKHCPHCGGRHRNGIQRMSFGTLFVVAAVFAVAMALLSSL